MPIRGIVHDGEVPDDAGGTVVSAAVCVSFGCSVTVTGIWETVGTTWIEVEVPRGAETVIKPGVVVVFWPPEFVVVRLTV
jgi:hypothetical protein